MHPPATRNYLKFQTRNPVARLTFGRFYRRLGRVITALAPESVLDAGCGEGETIARLGSVLPDGLVGFDINPESVAYAQERFPTMRFTVEDIYHLPYSDQSYDLVFCLEVLEHLERPLDALRELARVSRRDIVLSVPHEPWFRLGNLCRGKYLARWGDHPEHIQHWNRRTLTVLLEQAAVVVAVHDALPWLIAHCRAPR
jgi:SAM-dependent methyltransferase